MKDSKAYLILEDGQIFEGKRFGSDIESTGACVQYRYGRIYRNTY